MSRLSWFESKKGNQCCRYQGEIITVFPNRDRQGEEDGFKWVYDGEFSDEIFDTIAEAKESAEQRIRGLEPARKETAHKPSLEEKRAWQSKEDDVP